MLQTFDIGFSPCPNDTFIFDALVNRKIDTGDLRFVPVLEDVQTLNQWALNAKLPFTKLSFGVFPQVMNQYALLNSGAALGNGVGPLLIQHAMTKHAIGEEPVAIPGENTTAHLLFTLAYPGVTNKVFLRYDEIEAYVLSGKGPGVIIHENRFTYQDKGLVKVRDLGDYWEQQTQNPIPLGGIVVKRSIAKPIQAKVDELIRLSIEFAFANYPQLAPYVTLHAQEMSEQVMRQHIDLYVNPYSLDLGEKGKQAVNKFIEISQQLGSQEQSVVSPFI